MKVNIKSIFKDVVTGVSKKQKKTTKYNKSLGLWSKIDLSKNKSKKVYISAVLLLELEFVDKLKLGFVLELNEESVQQLKLES